MEKENKLREAAEEYALLMTGLKKGFDRKDELHFSQNRINLFDAIVISYKNGYKFNYQKEPLELEELRKQFEYRYDLTGLTKFGSDTTIKSIFNFFLPHLNQKVEQNDAVNRHLKEFKVCDSNGIRIEKRICTCTQFVTCSNCITV